MPKQDLDALIVLADDVRTEIVQAQKVIVEALTGPPNPALQAQLDALQQAITNPPDTGVPQQLAEVLAVLTRPAPKALRPSWQWMAAGLLTGVLCWGAGWGVARWESGKVSREAALMRAMDSILVERYALLPVPVQQSLTQVYKQFDFQDPGQRKRGAK
jgi:hypothetical protein